MIVDEQLHYEQLHEMPSSAISNQCIEEEAKEMVRVKGLEPSWAEAHTDLNRTRLPIPPHPHTIDAPWPDCLQGRRLLYNDFPVGQEGKGLPLPYLPTE